ncbi:hypothetical protein EV361DRAFT_364937 [Lentinula raphanica]|nr:hypothetical protein EV361DRAFT_364937 [Lentinula raphanica]
MVDLGTLCSDMEAAFEEQNEEAGSGIENTEQYKDSLTIGAVARQVARKIWDQTGFRFIYKSSRHHNSEKDIKMFQFFCAQFDAEQARVGGSNLHADVHKRRSRDRMIRYSCGGWLTITMREGTPGEARIRFTHQHHPPYVGCNPAHQKFIEDMQHHSPSNHSSTLYDIPGIHDVSVLDMPEVTTPTEEIAKEENFKLSGPSAPGAQDSSSSFSSDEEGEGTERIFFSEDTIRRAQENFELLLSVARQPQGVHPKLGRILKRTFDEVTRVGEYIQREKRRRTSKSTGL